MDILTCISTAENTHAILLELQIYIKDSNQDFVCGAVRCVGRITDAEPKVLDACIQGIMNLLLCTKSVIVASECVTVLRQMIQQNSLSPVSNRVMHQLVKLLITDMEDPIARSSVVWLVAEFHSALHKIAPDVLRILAKGFALEHTATKMQTLNLAVKQSLRLPDDEKVQALATYVLEMARYDLDTDLRDRARFLTALLGLAPAAEDGSEVAVDENALAELAEHAHAILLAPKLPPVTLLRSMDIDGVPAYSVGSMSSIVGHYCIGYEKLPPWSKVYADSSVRENFKLDGLEVDKLISSGFSRSLETVKEKSVDDLQIFYGDKRREIVSSSSESNSAVESVSSEEESDSSESESDSGSAVTSDSSDSEVSKLPASVHSKSSQGSKPINTSSSKNLVGVLSHETTTSQPDKKSGVVMRGGIRRVAKRTNNPSSSSDTTNQASSVISNNLLGFDQLQLGGNNEGKDLTSLLETEPHVSNQQKTAVDSLDVLFIESNKSVLSANQTSLQSSKISSMSFLDEVQDNAVVSKRDAILHSKVGPTEAFSATSSTIGDFAGLTMAPIATSIQKSNTVTVPEILSEPKILLKSELGGGLYVQMQFYYGGTTTHNKSGLWRAVLRIENVKEQPIR